MSIEFVAHVSHYIGHVAEGFHAEHIGVVANTLFSINLTYLGVRFLAEKRAAKKAAKLPHKAPARKGKHHRGRGH